MEACIISIRRKGSTKLNTEAKKWLKIATSKTVDIKNATEIKIHVYVYARFFVSLRSMAIKTNLHDAN